MEFLCSLKQENHTFPDVSYLQSSVIAMKLSYVEGWDLFGVLQVRTDTESKTQTYTF